MGVVIRRLEIGDWELFRELRLAALKGDPGVFLANYEESAKRSDESWKALLQDPNVGIFGLFDGEAAIGMTAISIDWDDPTKEKGLFWGSWLRPEYRNRGVSRLMYEARINWAKAHPTCKRVTVGHRESNIASKKANQRFGFRCTGQTEPRTWPDGQVEPMAEYELDV